MTKSLEKGTYPESAKSVVFYKKGRASVMTVSTPNDVFQKNAKSGGRWNVAVKPLAVGLCPSDMAGGALEFPPGNKRLLSDPKSPAVAGHEFVGEVVDINENGRAELRAKGIKIGDIVAGDINVGCGYCFQCKRGDPAVYCSNGATFAGVGSSPVAVDWVEKQTGRKHLPGAYTEGFVVLPSQNVHKIPKGVIKNISHLGLFSQVDAVSCAKTSCDTMGITTFKEMRGFDNPAVLVIGAGRLGTWHIAVIKELLPNAQIFIADIKKENLALVGRLFGIPKKHQYLALGKDPFSRERITRAFGKQVLFDFVIDTAGYGVLTGSMITDMLLSSCAQGGKFWTTAHTGVAGVDAGHPLLILGSKSFGNGLSPQNNFPFAIKFLKKNLEKYVGCMTEILGGLSDELARIVATGGSDYKRSASGTMFYSIVNVPKI